MDHVLDLVERVLELLKLKKSYRLRAQELRGVLSVLREVTVWHPQSFRVNSA